MATQQAITPAHRNINTCRTQRRSRRFRPFLDRLEDRLAPAQFTVTTLADENDGLTIGGVSLREALAAGDADTIDFAVAGAINLKSALPNLSGNLRMPAADHERQLAIPGDRSARVSLAETTHRRIRAARWPGREARLASPAD